MDSGGRSLINRLDYILTHTPEACVPTEWQIVIAGLRVLASQAACIAIAHGDEVNLVEERAKFDVLVSELRHLVSPDSLALPESTDSTRQSLVQTGQCNNDELRAFLLMIPLSALYWNARELEIPYRSAAKESNTTPSPILRVIVFLDHAPIASPQLLKPQHVVPVGISSPWSYMACRRDSPPHRFNNDLSAGRVLSFRIHSRSTMLY